MNDLRTSRVSRFASQVTGVSGKDSEGLFRGRRVLVSLEQGDLDSVETLMLALNQLLRFCPVVSLALPPDSPASLSRSCRDLEVAIHGGAGRMEFVATPDPRSFDATLAVGSRVLDVPGWIAATSDGWVARSASWVDGRMVLPPSRRDANVIGAHAAASIGAGRLFMYLLGIEPGPAHDLSLFDLATGPIGSMGSGPALPRSEVELDAFLIGCGSVMQAWAYTSRRLPIRGSVRAVDHQLLGEENLGTYVLGWLADVGRPKVDIMAGALRSRMKVIPDRDFAEFFEIRLEHGLPVAPVVIAGLDDVPARHTVQRWWPELLIDMATGGATSQVIVKNRADHGMCLIEALPMAPGTESELARRAQSAGLRADSALAGPTEAISDMDVAAADDHARAELERARQMGQLRCSRILAAEFDRAADPNFAPAAPFVAGLSGTVAAAVTIRSIAAERGHQSLHYQRSFRSERSRRLSLTANKVCECAHGGREAASA